MGDCKLTIVTVGSTGDIYPICAIAHGLKQNHCRVRIATHEPFRQFIQSQGFEFYPIAGDYRELLTSEQGYQLLEGKTQRLLSPALMQQQMLDAWQALQDADVAIFGPLALWGYHLAERLKIPTFFALLSPLSETAEFPFLKFGRSTRDSWQGALNKLSYPIAEFAAWRQDSDWTNQFRQERLGLEPLPWFGVRWRTDAPAFLSPPKVLYGFSSSIVPKPFDWGDDLHVTGYWFFDPPDPPSIPTTLSNFVFDGDAPIYIGFGSMTTRHPEQLSRIVLDAIRCTQQRAVVLRGWAGLTNVYNDPNVLMVDQAPHFWLFPKMKGAIHHGGAGTTAAVLRSGIPSITVPFFADQPAWGERLTDRNLSPASIPIQSLSVNALAEAIHTLITNTAMHQSAQRIAQIIGQEDGVKAAVKVICRVFS